LKAADQIGVVIHESNVWLTRNPVVPEFSKYKLVKAFLRWSRDHTASDLTAEERAQWDKLVAAINKVLH
jgi:hypothetical protein